MASTVMAWKYLVTSGRDKVRSEEAFLFMLRRLAYPYLWRHRTYGVQAGLLKNGLELNPLATVSSQLILSFKSALWRVCSRLSGPYVSWSGAETPAVDGCTS